MWLSTSTWNAPRSAYASALFFQYRRMMRALSVVSSTVAGMVMSETMASFHCSRKRNGGTSSR